MNNSVLKSLERYKHMSEGAKSVLKAENENSVHFKNYASNFENFRFAVSGEIEGFSEYMKNRIDVIKETTENIEIATKLNVLPKEFKVEYTSKIDVILPQIITLYIGYNFESGKLNAHYYNDGNVKKSYEFPLDKFEKAVNNNENPADIVRDFMVNFAAEYMEIEHSGIEVPSLNTKLSYNDIVSLGEKVGIENLCNYEKDRRNFIERVVAGIENLFEDNINSINSFIMECVSSSALYLEYADKIEQNRANSLVVTNGLFNFLGNINAPVSNDTVDGNGCAIFPCDCDYFNNNLAIPMEVHGALVNMISQMNENKLMDTYMLHSETRSCTMLNREILEKYKAIYNRDFSVGDISKIGEDALNYLANLERSEESVFMGYDIQHTFFYNSFSIENILENCFALCLMFHVCFGYAYDTFIKTLGEKTAFSILPMSDIPARSPIFDGIMIDVYDFDIDSDMNINSVSACTVYNNIKETHYFTCIKPIADNFKLENENEHIHLVSKEYLESLPSFVKNGIDNLSLTFDIKYDNEFNENIVEESIVEDDTALPEEVIANDTDDSNDMNNSATSEE